MSTQFPVPSLRSYAHESINWFPCVCNWRKHGSSISQCLLAINEAARFPPSQVNWALLTSFPSTLSSNCVSLKWTFVIRGLKGQEEKKKKKQMVVVLLFLKLTLQKFRKVSVEKDWFTVAPLYTAAVIAEFPCASSAFGHLSKQNSILILLCFSGKCRQAWNPQGPRSAASQTRCGAMRVSLSLRFFPT